MLDKRYALTDFVLEANSCETLYLWRECQDNDISWVQDNSGLSVDIGEFGDMPVNISVFWNTIDGLLVLFWDPISMVVHHDMIEKWFDKNCNPMYDNGTRRARTNAMNFHHVLHAAEDRKKITKPQHEDIEEAKNNVTGR